MLSEKYSPPLTARVMQSLYYNYITKEPLKYEKMRGEFVGIVQIEINKREKSKNCKITVGW